MRQFSNLLITKYSCFECEFLEVCVVFILFFILPITVADIERYFSKLKTTKEFKNFISDFANMIARKKNKLKLLSLFLIYFIINTFI